MAPPDSPPEAPDALRPAPAAGDAPKYTWDQLDAALQEPGEADRAAFDILLPAAELQARGAKISMRASTSSWGLPQFWAEKAYRVSCCSPSLRAARTTRRTAWLPAR